MSRFLRPIEPQELGLFIERIGRSLAERPLAIGITEHREKVAGLVRDVGGSSFYQLLALGPAASPEKVHEAYERVARLVHPVHASHLGLEGREAVLEMLFERATAAYLTLSHAGRRRDYDREVGPAGWSGAETSSSRSHGEENRDRARASYNRALAYAAKEEFHFAIEQMREAVRIDPQAKYYVALGDLLMRNAHWVHQAADCFERALELGGPDPQVEQALARAQGRLRGGAEPATVGTPALGGHVSGGRSAAERSPGAASPPAAAGASAAFSAGEGNGDDVGDGADDEADSDDPAMARWLRRDS